METPKRKIHSILNRVRFKRVDIDFPQILLACDVSEREVQGFWCFAIFVCEFLCMIVMH